MPIPEKTVVETELEGEISVNGGPARPVKAILRSTRVVFQIRGRIEVDIEKLQSSRELHDEQVSALKRAGPDRPILFMGKLPDGGINGKNVCIGIKTGKHVYPLNMFFISEATAVDCCTPIDEPPHEIESY